MDRQTLKQGIAQVPAIATGFVGDAFNVVSAAGTFQNAIDEGDHPIVAGFKGAGEFIAGEVFYSGMASELGLVGSIKGGLIATGITLAANFAAQHMENTGQVMGQGYESVKGLGSGHFNMTQAGYTMRQRSLNAIRTNGVNINSAFGNEARNYYLGL